jgi:hypothetical protein
MVAVADRTVSASIVSAVLTFVVYSAHDPATFQSALR